MVYIKYKIYFKSGKELEIKRALYDNIEDKEDFFNQEASNVYSMMNDGIGCIRIITDSNNITNINLSNIDYINIIYDDSEDKILKENEEKEMQKKKVLDEMLSPSILDESDLFD